MAAIYAALQACEAITGAAAVTVQSTYPVLGWLLSWMKVPKSGVTQLPTMAKWGAYLEQRAAFSSSPLAQQLHELLGPVTFKAVSGEEPPLPPSEEDSSPYVEGKAPIPAEAWYADGSSRGNPPSWMAIGMRLDTDELWFKTGVGQSSQWTELHAVWLVFKHEPGVVLVCSDSWAVYQGLNLWFPRWSAQN